MITTAPDFLTQNLGFQHWSVQYPDYSLRKSSTGIAF